MRHVHSTAGQLGTRLLFMNTLAPWPFQFDKKQNKKIQTAVTNITHGQAWFETTKINLTFRMLQHASSEVSVTKWERFKNEKYKARYW